MRIYKKAYTLRACELSGGSACGGNTNVSAGGAVGIKESRVALYQSKCDSGNGSTCANLANEFNKAKPELALSLNLKSCELEHSVGCYRASRQFTIGHGTPVDHTQALTLLENTCAQNTTDCYALANAYLRGEIVDTNKDRAAELYHSACWADPSNLNVCGKAVRQEFEILSPDVDDMVPAVLREAVAEARQGCLAEVAASCYDLALIARGLTWTYPLPSKSYDLIVKACSLGEPRACLDGASGKTGEAAKVIFDQACDAGSMSACIEPIVRDRETSAEVRIAQLEVLCDEALAVACAELANMHSGRSILYNMRHPNPDKGLAVKFAQKVCELGAGNGCTLLGQMATHNRYDDRFDTFEKDIQKAVSHF